MNFLEILIFIAVFTIVLFYFGIQFYNVSKINDYIAISRIKKDLNIIDKIQRLFRLNMVSYCAAYIILSVIYFLLTKKAGLFISIIAFLILFAKYAIYHKAQSSKIYDYKIKLYKTYSFINFIFNLAIIFAINIFFILFMIAY